MARILYLEDEAWQVERSTVRILVVEFGHVVTLAKSIPDAIGKLRQQRFDAIIADLNMYVDSPLTFEDSAFYFLQRIRQGAYLEHGVSSTMPIVIASGYCDDIVRWQHGESIRVRDAIMQLGIAEDCTIQKPCAADVLDRAVQAAMHHAQLEGAVAQQPPQRVDVAIITALSEELRPVLDLCGGEAAWRRETVQNFVHYRGRIAAGESQLEVVASSLWKYGMTPTASEVIRSSVYSPRILCMCGICAGWKTNGIALGDVIVADRAYQPFEGKLVPGALRPDLHTDSPPPYIMQWLKLCSPHTAWQDQIVTPRPVTLRYQCQLVLHMILQSQHGALSPENTVQLRAQCPQFDRAWDILLANGCVDEAGHIATVGSKYLNDNVYRGLGATPPVQDPTRPKVHIGAFATIPCVLEDERLFESEAERIRKIKAVDMELAAFFSACNELGKPGIGVKGVCDYADSSKDDAFHPYSAEAAARYLSEFLARFGDQIKALP